MYEFSGFALLKITTPEDTYFKVFGSTSGSYLYGSGWKINSGVTRVECDEMYYYFYGNSGSCYKVAKGGGRLSVHSMAVLGEVLSQEGVEMVSNDEVESVLKEHGIEIKEVV